MNHNIIYAAIGFIVGGLAGGFFMGCYCGKVYKKRIDTLEIENDILRSDRDTKKNKEIAEREKKAENHKLSKKTAEDIIGYHEYVAPEHEETNEEDEEDSHETDFYEDTDVDFDDPFEDGSEDDDEREMIKLISKKAYNEDLQYRDSETLTYYVEDGILADAYDDPVSNAAEVIGIEAIEKAETTSDDEIYVSNDIEDKIYEIIVEHNESFYRDIVR